MSETVKLTICITALIFVSFWVGAQNPNWTMPPRKFQGSGPAYSLLPQTPTHPVLGTITDPTLAYQGAPSTNMHAAYSDNHGNLLFFTVDEYVYDDKGFVVGKLKGDTDPNPKLKRGFNERLILPMGNSCEKFGILNVGSADHNTSGYEIFNTSSRPRLYMAIYDIAARSKPES